LRLPVNCILGERWFFFDGRDGFSLMGGWRRGLDGWDGWGWIKGYEVYVR
jgi:hypothetical protein